MTKEEAMDILGKTGAILTGHFELSSGLHTEQYIQCALTFQYPKYAAWLARAIADKYRTEMISAVVGPAVGAIVLAHEVAKAVGARAIFTEREQGKMRLRRGFDLTKNDRVLIVEDVVTTGSSIGELIEIVRDHDARLVGIAAIVDRTDQTLGFKDKFQYLIKSPIKNFSPDKCPLCKEGKPLIRPGSRGLES